MSDKDKIENLKPLDPAKYQTVDLDHLVMYAISQLEKIGADLSFENAVVAAFKIFPIKFSLPGFPSYPAAKRVHDCLFRCTFKTKKWLGGKTCQGFTITDRSRRFIKEAEDLLRETSTKKTKPTSRRRKDLLLAEVERSPAYLKYTNAQIESISEADLCYLLQGTLDSSREILWENFQALKKLVTEVERKDMYEFLQWLEERVTNLLKE